MVMSRSRVRRIVVQKRLAALSDAYQVQQNFKRWAARNNVALCKHCGEALSQDGTCPGLCVPCERD